MYSNCANIHITVILHWFHCFCLSTEILLIIDLLFCVCGLSGYFGDDILCHFCASMISGLVTTAASMPVDIVKTRYVHSMTFDMTFLFPLCRNSHFVLCQAG